jgi:hypothetical protein
LELAGDENSGTIDAPAKRRQAYYTEFRAPLARKLNAEARTQ